MKELGKYIIYIILFWLCVMLESTIAHFLGYSRTLIESQLNVLIMIVFIHLAKSKDE